MLKSSAFLLQVCAHVALPVCLLLLHNTENCSVTSLKHETELELNVMRKAKSHVTLPNVLTCNKGKGRKNELNYPVHLGPSSWKVLSFLSSTPSQIAYSTLILVWFSNPISVPLSAIMVSDVHIME